MTNTQKSLENTLGNIEIELHNAGMSNREIGNESERLRAELEWLASK